MQIIREIFIKNIVDISPEEMGKLLGIIKGIIRGDVSIERIDKTYISKTPGDVTDVSHN